MTIRLSAGRTTALVEPGSGGRLASLVIGGRERLVTHPVAGAEFPGISWGSFPMVPWVGRLRDGRLDWRGETFHLARNFRGHAIHGTVFDRAWQVEHADGRSATLTCRLGDGDGWPFGADVTQVIELAAQAIVFRIEVHADVAMPVAIGWHPWFRRDGDEHIAISVPADRVIETTEDLIPTGRTLAVAGETDLRRAVEIGERALDHTYIAPSGPSRLVWKDLELLIEAAPMVAVVVHTTRSGVCIEPQTAWPDAVRMEAEERPSGLRSLPAGGRFAATSRWSWLTRTTERG